MKISNQWAIAGLFGVAAMLVGNDLASAIEKDATPAAVPNSDIMIQLSPKMEPRPLGDFCVDIDTANTSSLNGVQVQIITAFLDAHQKNFEKMMLSGNAILRDNPETFGNDKFPEMCIIYPGMEKLIDQARPGRLDKTVVIDLADWLKADNNDSRKDALVNAVENAVRKNATQKLGLTPQIG